MDNVSSSAGIADRPFDYVDTSPRGLAGLTRDAWKIALASPLLFFVLPAALYFPFEWIADLVSASKTSELAALNAYLRIFNLATLFVGTYVAAVALIAARSMLETGQRPSPRAAMGEGLRRYGSFLHTAWSAGWRIMLGFIAFGVPGVILSVRYALALPVTAMEGLEGPAALARSKELVRGQAWRVFFLGLGGVVLFSLAAATPTMFIADDASPLVDALANSAGNALLPLLELGALLIYLDGARVGGFRPVRNLRAGDAPVSSGRAVVALTACAFIAAFTASVIVQIARDPGFARALHDDGAGDFTP